MSHQRSIVHHFFPLNVKGEISKLKVITIEKQNYFKRYEFCPYKMYSSNQKSTEHFYYVYEKYKTVYLLEFSLAVKNYAVLKIRFKN